MAPKACFVCDLSPGQVPSGVKLNSQKLEKTIEGKVDLKQALFTTSCFLLQEYLLGDPEFPSISRKQILKLIQVIRDKLEDSDTKASVFQLLNHLGLASVEIKIEEGSLGRINDEEKETLQKAVQQLIGTPKDHTAKADNTFREDYSNNEGNGGDYSSNDNQSNSGDGADFYVGGNYDDDDASSVGEIYVGKISPYNSEEEEEEESDYEAPHKKKKVTYDSTHTREVLLKQEGSSDGLPLLDLSDEAHIKLLYKTPPCSHVCINGWFACPYEGVCGMVVETKVDLYKHYLRAHCSDEIKPEPHLPKMKEVPFKSKCNTCKAQFMNSTWLQRHVVLGSCSAKGKKNPDPLDIKKASSGDEDDPLMIKPIIPSLFSKGPVLKDTVCTAVEELMLKEAGLKQFDLQVNLLQFSFTRPKKAKPIRTPIKPYYGTAILHECWEPECKRDEVAFDTIKKLATHMYRAHEKTKCCMCGNYVAKQTLKTHLSVCSGNGVAIGDRDDPYTGTGGGFRSTMKKIVKKRKLEHCEKKQKRVKHVAASDEDLLASGRYLRCGECSKVLGRSGIAKHYQWSHNKPYWSCDHCPVTFFHKKSLDDHYTKNHLEERGKSWKTCDLCGDSFAEKHLEEHKINCEGNNVKTKKAKAPKQCEECQEMVERDHFLEHMSIIHNKPMTCQVPDCSLQLHSSVEQREHMAQAHPKHRRIFTCEMCTSDPKLKFLKISALAEHQLTDHGKNIKCNQCDLEFTKKAYFRSHKLKVHGILIKNSRSHTCAMCDTFSTFIIREYHQHMLTVHGVHHKRSKREICYKCGMELEVKSMAKHLSKCDGKLRDYRTREGLKRFKKIFKCEKCPEEEVMTENQLAWHMKEVHNEKYFKCVYCPEMFHTYGDRRKHSQDTHVVEGIAGLRGQNIMCEQCGLELLANGLKGHLRRCDGKSIQAKQRQFGMANRAQGAVEKKKCYGLGLYTRFNEAYIENEEDKTKCGYKGCDYQDKERNLLLVHYMVTHAKAFCEFCEDLFPVKDMDAHLETAHNETDYPKFPCDLCDKTFHNDQFLAFHRDHVHIKELTYECELCSKMFITDRARRAHKYNQHMAGPLKPRKDCHTSAVPTMGYYTRFPNAFQENLTDNTKCADEECDFQSEDRNTLLMHYMFYHASVACEDCGVFFAMKEIDGHLGIEHGKYDYPKHPCDLCDKTFDRNKYLVKHRDVVHIQERKYKCHLCDQKFISEETKKAHLYAVHRRFTCKKCGHVEKKVLRYRKHMLNAHGEDVGTAPIKKGGYTWGVNDPVSNPGSRKTKTKRKPAPVPTSPDPIIDPVIESPQIQQQQQAAYQALLQQQHHQNAMMQSYVQHSQQQPLPSMPMVMGTNPIVDNTAGFNQRH